LPFDADLINFYAADCINHSNREIFIWPEAAAAAIVKRFTTFLPAIFPLTQLFFGAFPASIHCGLVKVHPLLLPYRSAIIYYWVWVLLLLDDDAHSQRHQNYAETNRKTLPLSTAHSGWSSKSVPNVSYRRKGVKCEWNGCVVPSLLFPPPLLPKAISQKSFSPAIFAFLSTDPSPLTFFNCGW
jgi:hypothetical protein